MDSRHACRLLDEMGGSHVHGSADKAGIMALQELQARNSTSTNGSAAFLVAEHKLGAPLGQATLDGAGKVYTRQFAHATVAFNTATNKGHFQWD